MKVIPPTQTIALCSDCRHFSITKGEQFPYRCKTMKFKGKQRPSAIIFSSTNLPCQLFSPQKKKR